MTNPLAVMGWCDTQPIAGTLPRRHTVHFDNATLTDQPPDLTRVALGAPERVQYAALGVGVAPSGVYDDGVVLHYYYDETGGDWFGAPLLYATPRASAREPLETEFAGASFVLIRTEYPEGVSAIYLTGIAPDPRLSVQRKVLLNLGPHPFSLTNRDTGDPGAIQGAPLPLELRPKQGARIFWDDVSKFWRPTMRLLGPGTPGHYDVTIDREPLVHTIPGYDPEQIVITPSPPTVTRKS